MHDIYLFGMVLLTTSILLKGEYPEPDSYGEVLERHTTVGGETGTCAAVLASLGAAVRIDGNHLGRTTCGPLADYFTGKGVDLSAMTNDPEYEGLQDMVLIGGHTRTCIGEFQRYFADPGHGRWNAPKRKDIGGSKAAGIDPFFFDASIAAARYCQEAGVPYVTVDCEYDSELHRLSGVNIVSNEFIRGHYAGWDTGSLFRRYADHSGGLTIFTFGAEEILYGRRGEAVRRFSPYRVQVASTLGAGDSFKAGAVYAVSRGMDDDRIVAFASATAAAAVSRYPIPEYPPTLRMIREIMESR